MSSAIFERSGDKEKQSPVIDSFPVNGKAPLDTPGRSFEKPDPLSQVDDSRPPPPQHKYGKKWWVKTWNTAVSGGVWPRVLYITFGVVVISVWIGTTVYFATEEVKWNRDVEQQLSEQVAQNPPLGGGPFIQGNSSARIISLSGSLKQFDQNARNLVIEWSGLFQDNANSDPVPLANGTAPNNFMPLSIYRDISTVLYSARTTEITRTAPATKDDYFFRIDNSSAPSIGAIGMHTWDSFTTDISFSQATDTATATSQPQFSYPYDEWKGKVTFVASWAIPGLSLVPTLQGNYSGAIIQALAGARLEDNSLNWRFSLTFDNPCPTDSKERDKYILAASGNTSSTFVGMDNIELGFVIVPCHLAITIHASRPPVVVFAAVMSVIVNWTSTIFIFILTCECLIMRRGFVMAGSDLLGVTFTALFALPSVRMLLPGAPDFGCLIDLVGIIPQVIIVSLCITAIAVTKLHMKFGAAKKED